VHTIQLVAAVLGVQAGDAVEVAALRARARQG
jgi:hypothetical protein